jgi:hypothetical protein
MGSWLKGTLPPESRLATPSALPRAPIASLSFCTADSRSLRALAGLSVPASRLVPPE